MFKATDTMCLQFALVAEGMELNKADVHKSHNVLHVTSPLKVGSLVPSGPVMPGLRHSCKPHCGHARLLSYMQGSIRRGGREGGGGLKGGGRGGGGSAGPSLLLWAPYGPRRRRTEIL